MKLWYGLSSNKTYSKVLAILNFFSYFLNRDACGIIDCIYFMGLMDCIYLVNDFLNELSDL